MSIIARTGSTPWDGQVIAGGTPFVPIDEDSAFATYERQGVTCTVAYETGRDYHYLRFCPAWQLPRGARDERAWRRFVFGLDDDRALEIHMDPADGEVRYSYSETPLDDLDDIERSIEAGLELVCGVYPEVARHVADQLGVRG